MATSPLFGWEEPDDTDLVKDGAAAIRTLGNAIDTSMGDLLGGTSGQVLSKNSNTNMDFTWVTPDDANAIQNAIVDAKGDLITATAADTPARLAVGTNGQVLTADSTAATGLKWATAASGSTFSGASVYFSATLTLTANTEVVIGFNSENYDTNTYHDNSTNNSRLTVPSTGYYLVSGYYISNQTGNRRMIYIKKNGTTQTQYTAFAGTGITECTSVASGVYYATAGDYFTLVAYSENATPATAQAGSIYNNFSIAYLGA